MHDKKSAFNADEPSPLEKEIEQLQELLKSLVGDTSVLMGTHVDDEPGSLGASADVWESSSASPFQSPLQNPPLDWLEVCNDYVN